MDLFVKYDIERLSQYASLPQNKTKITVDVANGYVSLRFNDVNYFNYAVCLATHELADIVPQVQSFYEQTQHHRLLIEDATGAGEHHTYLRQQGYTLKGRQMLVHDPDRVGHRHTQPLTASLEPVSETTLHAFTRDYLAGFESEQSNTEPVALNFGRLLTSPNISLYRVIAAGQPVGIAGLYRSDNHFLLAGGAILPSYRQQGYHTSALLSRLAHCYEHQPDSISAWAYEDSVSYHNMRRIGLAPYKRYWIYEH